MNQENSVGVELAFAARELKAMDSFSQSDPFLRFYIQKDKFGNIDPCGQTEHKDNTANPTWDTQISVRYFFNEMQPLRV